MEKFPLVVLLIGLFVTIATFRYSRYRRLTLIGNGAFPCILYMIQPDYWILYLTVFIAVYISEFWEIRKETTNQE